MPMAFQLLLVISGVESPTQATEDSYESGTGYGFAGCGAFCAALIFAIDWFVGKHGH